MSVGRAGSVPPLQNHFKKDFVFSTIFINRHKLIFFHLARFQFYHSLFQTFFSHRHADRTADQIRVVEFDPGAFVPVIEQDRNACALQSVINLFGFGASIHFFAGDVHKIHIERRGGMRESQALVIVMCFGEGKQNIFKIDILCG